MAVAMMVVEGNAVRGRKVAGSYDGKPMDFDVQYEGLVVGMRERNWHDDSDYYAIVWNAEKGEPMEVMYATTRGWTYPNHAVVDATPEVKAAYDAYCRKQEELARQEAAEREARIPRKGKRVKVVKGRKIAHGKTGEVFWYGQSKFGGYSVGMILDSGETVFTNAQHVEVMRNAGADVEGFDEI